MRFGLVHRIMTNLLALLGVLALVTSGELGRTTSVLILVGLAAAVLVPERWQNHPLSNRFATIAPLIVLALQLGRLAWGAPLLEVTVEFAIVLQIVRLATRRGAAPRPAGNRPGMAAPHRRDGSRRGPRIRVVLRCLPGGRSWRTRPFPISGEKWKATIDKVHETERDCPWMFHASCGADGWSASPSWQSRAFSLCPSSCLPQLSSSCFPALGCHCCC